MPLQKACPCATEDATELLDADIDAVVLESKRGREVVRPKVVVLVDYPGLNLRLANELRKAGLSRAHFFALFQRDTQVTPLVYANVLRFEAAVAGVVPVIRVLQESLAGAHVGPRKHASDTSRKAASGPPYRESIERVWRPYQGERRISLPLDTPIGNPSLILP